VNLIYKVNCHLVGMSVIQAYYRLHLPAVAVLPNCSLVTIQPFRSSSRHWR